MEPSEPPTRVLYVEASTTGVVGGSTTGLQHFLQGLDRRRYEPIVLLYERKALASELEHLGIGVRVMPRQRTTVRLRSSPQQSSSGGKKLTLWRRIRRHLREAVLFCLETCPAAWRLARLMKREQPHLVHLVNGFRSNLDGVVAAWLAGIPCICHVKKFENYGWVDRLFARTVRLGICMTEAIRQHCQDHRIRPRRLVVIYDGIDTEHFCPTRDAANRVRHEWNIPAGAPLVGIVGNIRSWKGQAVVVRAIKQLRSCFPTIRCLIIGGVHPQGVAYAEGIHEYVAAHGLEQNVIFTGFRQDVPDLMAALDLVIHASITPEPFGRVILEGMALGKPVIATNLGGVPEFVQDGVTGALIPPDEPQALAAAMKNLLADTAYSVRLGRNAQAEVGRRFIVAQHVEQVLEAYTSLGATKAVA